MTQAKLVMMRHGQSVWNLKNIFTGWVDVPLSEQGIREALDAGKSIEEIPFDIIYTSNLIRAKMTAMLAMLNHKSGKFPVILHTHDEEKQEWGKASGDILEKEAIPVVCAWQLNERFYGGLQGLNKAKTKEKYGEEQVQIWRRSFDTPPPDGESLKMTAERTIPYFNEMIVPHLAKGQNVLISAHGNSLRAILMELDGLSPDEVVQLELETGKPITYTYSANRFSKVVV